MNCRSLLIGTGTILSTAFVDKANWFLRNQNSVVPFFENNEAAQKLYFVKEAEDCYDIKLGTPEYGFCLSPLELCQYILAKGVRNHGSKALF